MTPLEREPNVSHFTRKCATLINHLAQGLPSGSMKGLRIRFADNEAACSFPLAIAFTADGGVWGVEALSPGPTFQMWPARRVLPERVAELRAAVGISV